MNKFFIWLEQLKQTGYCICDVPNEKVDFTMIDTELWGKLNDDEEARKIINKHLDKYS